MNSPSQLSKRPISPTGESSQPKKVKVENDLLEASRLTVLEKGKTPLASDSLEPRGSNEDNRDQCLVELTGSIPPEEAGRIFAISREDRLRTLAFHLQETRFLTSALVVDNQEMIANTANFHDALQRKRTRERWLENALAEANRNLAVLKRELKTLRKERSEWRKTLLASMESLVHDSDDEDEEGSSSS